MDFRVLGPLEVSVAGQPVVVSTAPKRQLALAALLARAGQPVSVDTLIEAVWGQRPPASARRNLQQYIHGLRRILGDDRIATRGDSYALDPGANLDAIDFRRLAADGAAALNAGDAATAQAGLRAALDLWRGPAFAEFLDCELVAEEAARLELLRLETFERWVEVQLVTGATPGLVAELTELCRLHPYRENLRALLMRALYHTGRRVEALAVFRETRALLVDEVGVEPGMPLQRLHEAMLRGGEALASPPGPEGVVPASDAVAPRLRPRQLPAPPHRFTGRIAEQAALDQSHDLSTVVISAIDGMAGIGKTALAVHAAHQLADRYPDGQLFIDLHGYTEGMQPIEPVEALDHLLRALGIPGPQIPAGLDQRAALYRTRMAGQRVLVVLDNAATENQVAPLLPGTPGCLVLVTSRRRLTGLDPTYTLSLDTLPTPDAVTLFVQTAGEDRLAGMPPELLAELVELCGRLPLAIRIAAARLRSHPTWHLHHLVERLRDRRHRLAELEAGQRSVTAALDLSYQHLNADQQRAYRLLGSHPGPEFDAYASAALLDSTLPHAIQLLDQLLEAHLVHEPTPGRYGFHDLTRAHAGTRAIDVAALARLLDYYRHTASLAMDAAYPYEREHRPQVARASTPTQGLGDPAHALRWLDTELPNLLSAARYAIEHRHPAYILDLSNVLHQHLRSRGYYHDAETLHRQALAAADAASDQVRHLTGLGDIHWRQGRYATAADHFGQALQLARATGNRPSELEVLVGLGNIHLRQGRTTRATDHFEQALQLARATGNRPSKLEALFGLGHIHRLQGRQAMAADHFGQALQLARATGNRPSELEVLVGLGHIHLRQGQFAQATECYRGALELANATGNRPSKLTALTGLGHTHRLQGQYALAADHFERAVQLGDAAGNRSGALSALIGLGDVHRLQGRHTLAIDYYQRVLTLAHKEGDRNWQFEAWQGLGRLRQADRPEVAIAHHDKALALARELGQPEDQARAHDGLAHSYHALNQHEQARMHWRSALSILTDLGVDRTDDEEASTAAIRMHLAAIAERYPTRVD
jgi:DNA-binding SARP family transcriptional activator/tetratricopeptide (TPR) repeat protein